MSGFDWDDANRDHIAEHGVSVAEAEEASTGPTLDIDEYVVDGELRFEDVGITHAGRILKIVSTERAGKIRIVTAFDPSPAMRRRYLRMMVTSYE